MCDTKYDKDFLEFQDYVANNSGDDKWKEEQKLFAKIREINNKINSRITIPEVDPHNNLVGGLTDGDEENKEYRGRHFMFTAFDEIKWPDKNMKDLKEAVCQYEKCPKTGRTHLQGCVRFGETTTWKAVKARIGGAKTWLKGVRAKDWKKVCNYCQKKETRIKAPDGTETYFFGSNPEPGKRNDIVEIIEELKQNKPLMEIYEERPGTMSKAFRFIDRYKQMLDKKNRKGFRDMEVELWIGVTGTNKSRNAIYLAPDYLDEDPNVYVMNPPDKNKQGWDKIWWDDYEGEKTIVLEEFNGWMGIENFLILTGGHKMRMAIKGGQTYGNHSKVIITSNKEPTDWWPQIIDEHWEALIRRITKVRKFQKGGIILEGGTEMLTFNHNGNNGRLGYNADALVAKK